ncbi:MAG: AbrB/MazE/SpoVT family DNA-binding domain-containing protein [Clostridiaceae bacterium]|nr:AbrB/MazE/SpoVT family DNA-binding domain-containing protein [Clostridiaceae bacterium]
MTSTVRERNGMERKIINVSSKRQITIPLKFYEHLDLGNEVECLLEDGRIIIQPLHRGPNEFSVEILKELVSHGYSGDELIKQFETQNENIKKAIANMLEEADAITAGRKPSASFDELFGSED